MTSLVYEGNQAINFIKKYLRYNRLDDISGNKLGKKGLFSPTLKYMADAVGNYNCTIALH